MDAGTVNGAIERFLTYTNSQLLVIGPWNHGGRQFYDPFLETNRSRITLEKEQAQEKKSDITQWVRECGRQPTYGPSRDSRRHLSIFIQIVV